MDSEYILSNKPLNTNTAGIVAVTRPDNVTGQGLRMRKLNSMPPSTNDMHSFKAKLTQIPR